MTAGTSIGTARDGRFAPIAAGIRDLHPAYFAAVMSTGIVSLAFDGLGVGLVARALADLNLVLYTVLVALFGTRLLAFTGEMIADFHSGRRWGYLTFVVGTNTVGVQTITFFGAPRVAATLWIVGAVVCVVLLTALYADWAVSRTDTARSVDGTILLSTVALQSVAVLGIDLHGVVGHPLLRYVSVGAWAAGFVFYLITITLVVYRLFAVGLEPREWTGPYWIMMGAVAITTLAGASIVSSLAALPGWDAVATGILAITVLAWSIGTMWIPFQLVLDVWKFRSLNVGSTVPAWITAFPWLRLGFGEEYHFYEPPAWGRTFPMGMYTACTLALAKIAPFGALAVIPHVWGWFALAVWALTFVGMARATVRGIVPAVSRPETAEQYH